jgi:hypothetical protein
MFTVWRLGVYRDYLLNSVCPDFPIFALIHQFMYVPRTPWHSDKWSRSSRLYSVEVLGARPQGARIFEMRLLASLQKLHNNNM